MIIIDEKKAGMSYASLYFLTKKVGDNHGSIKR